MGIAIADAASDYGADVELVLGPADTLPGNSSVKIINVTTAESMAAECISRFPECNIAILSAAVADFTTEEVKGTKIKNEGKELIIKLIPTLDIAATLGKTKRPSQFIAGFALETNNETDNAIEKLHRKNLDIIVLNSLNDRGAGFGHDTNKITIIDRYNNIDKFELKSKKEAAKDILNKIISMIQ
jgi:phosphopantothenoylcysteine decarboxylase/phosphopantothenate--cysteine ligase